MNAAAGIVAGRVGRRFDDLFIVILAEDPTQEVQEETVVSVEVLQDVDVAGEDPEDGEAVTFDGVVVIGGGGCVGVHKIGAFENVDQEGIVEESEDFCGLDEGG